MKLALRLLLVAILPACLTVEDEEPATTAPTIVVEPLLLDFAEVHLRDPVERSLRIENTGDAPLDLLAGVLSHAAFELLDVGEFPVTLPPDAEVDWTVRYTTPQDEHAEATLTVVSTDFTSPETVVRLVAEGIAPTVRIDPETFDMGDLEIGCISEIEVRVSNVGRSSLTVDDIVLDDLVGNGEFSLTNAIPQGARLAPSEAWSVTVSYVPLDVAPDTAILEVTSNDPRQPSVRATFTGIAHEGRRVTDTFIQAPPAVDLLLVVDEADALAAADFTPFIDRLTSIGLDWRVGVVSTGSPITGTLTAPVVTGSTPNAADAIGQSVAAAASTSYGHEGFEAARACFQNAVDGCDAGFDRGDAAVLSVLFVSSAQEESTDLAGVAEYVNFFYALRTTSAHVTLSDFSGGLSGCSGANATAVSGSDYVAASVATGGLSASVCDPAVTTNLVAFADVGVSSRLNFALAETPASDIEVMVDGVFATGWTYSSSLNAVVFDAVSIPPSGATIAVSYTVLGDCRD